MHGFQAVANVRQCAAYDYAHGVIEIRPPHLVFDIDGYYVFAVATTSCAAEWQLGGRRGALRRLFLICQANSLLWFKPYFTINIRLERGT